MQDIIPTINEVSIYNPTELLLENEIRLVLPDTLIKHYNLNSDFRAQNIKRDLIENNRNKSLYTCFCHAFFVPIVSELFDVVSNLPKLISITYSKPVLPTFQRIDVEDTDTQEIEKFIRKVNYDFLGFSCNHSAIEEKCDQVFKKITDLQESEPWKNIDKFYNDCVECFLEIYRKDGDQFYYLSPQNPYYGLGFPTKDEIKLAVRNIRKINSQIITINSQSTKKCSKCDAAKRKYEYSVFEISRLRDRLKQQRIIDEQYINTPDEDKFNIREFMTKNYPTIKRFPLTDVQQKYKATYKINIPLDELKIMVENTGLFTVTNVSHKLFVNRL